MRQFTGTPPTGADALSLLTAFVSLTLAIPSKYTIAAMGGAGSPSTVVGLLCFAAWAFMHISRSEPTPMVGNPVRRAVLLLLATLLVSYIVAARRPGGQEELWYSQFFLLLLTGWLGVALWTCDFIATQASLERLLQRLALGAGFFGLLGILQYYTGLPLINDLPLPGLSLNQALVSVTDRDGLNRPSSTAIHAIEFGVAMAALLPICLHVLFHAPHLSSVRRWFPVVALLVATPLCISRSAVICTAVALVLLVPTWPSRARGTAITLAIAFSMFTFVASPGVLGTLLGLFSGVANDPSVDSRTDSYALAGHFISQNPVFGRGVGTFLPQYRILDNQYLLLLIETGVVGLLACLGVFITSIAAMVVVRHRHPDAQTRDLAQSILASLASVGTGYAFFDGLSFQLYACVTFLIVGVAGAVWRLDAIERSSTQSPLELSRSYL